MESSIEKSLIRDIHRTARALGIPDGATDLFIHHALPGIKHSLKGKSIITTTDLDRIVAKEFKKYNRDLAYVYKIHDIII